MRRFVHIFVLLSIVSLAVGSIFGVSPVSAASRCANVPITPASLKMVGSLCFEALGIPSDRAATTIDFSYPSPRHEGGSILKTPDSLFVVVNDNLEPIKHTTFGAAKDGYKAAFYDLLIIIGPHTKAGTYKMSLGMHLNGGLGNIVITYTIKVNSAHHAEVVTSVISRQSAQLAVRNVAA